MTELSHTPAGKGASTTAVYGTPDRALVESPEGATQVSPLVPGAATLEEIADGTLREILIAAPPGTLERRAVLAHALRALAPGGVLTALAPKTKGGGRIEAELDAFGCAPQARSKGHQRIVTTTRPAALIGIDAAIAEGAARFDETMELWTQPGVFSWNRIDTGTGVLLAAIEALEAPLAGVGADFGCGVGVLMRAALAFPGVSAARGIDIDRRAIACARQNLDDPRAQFTWADVRTHRLSGVDFVVANAPFHDGGAEDKALGVAFIAAAARALRQDGRLLLVANRHLPYEEPLRAKFRTGRVLVEADGFKVFEARR